VDARNPEVDVVVQLPVADPAMLDVLQKAVDRAAVGTVFGEPITREGVTVIPVARVRSAAGGGGGGGSGEGGESGGGTGTGVALSSRPVGVYVIKDGVVTWQPSIDVTRIVLGGQVVAIVALLTARSLVRRRRRRHRQ
jgi:uncharacterized spore protein YtfJ